MTDKGIYPLVDCGSIVCCGIECSSRYDNANEMIEMMQFAVACFRVDLAKFVKAVFYDSKGCIANVELHPPCVASDAIGQRVIEVGEGSLRMFMVGEEGCYFCDDWQDHEDGLKDIPWYGLN